VPNPVYYEYKHIVHDLGFDRLSADDLKKKVVGLGYLGNMIKQMYFSKPHLPLEENLVPIVSDQDLHELITLRSKLEYVYISIEHIKVNDIIIDCV